MITHPAALVCALVLIEAAVLYVSSRKRFQRYFSFIPPVFWIYCIPLIASATGVIAASSPVYQWLSTYLLPASLVLLLMSSDVRAISALKGKALLMMAAGSLGIMIGIPVAFALFKGAAGAQMWSGFGALSASWVGGSANMVAAKEAIGVPDAVFAPMVIVDTVVPYAWMGLLVAGAGLQPLFDRRFRADRKVLDQLALRMQGCGDTGRKGCAVKKLPAGRAAAALLLILGIAAAGATFSHLCAKAFPTVKDVISTYTWTIIIVSALGIALSFTPGRALEAHGASRIGYWLLYLVLTSIGARASVANVGAAAVLIAAGAVAVVIHALVLLIAARVLRAPMFLAAAASQANIGGVASAPVVAAIYQPGLATVGLLMAILGNICGTYTGIFTAHMCRLIAGWGG